MSWTSNYTCTGTDTLHMHLYMHLHMPTAHSINTVTKLVVRNQERQKAVRRHDKENHTVHK